VKDLVKKSVTAQRIYRAYLRRQRAAHLPDWNTVLRESADLWRAARASARGPRVLIATTTGGHPSAPVMESLLAVALTLRGADVHFLLCDAALPGCLLVERQLMAPAQFARGGPQDYFCRGCFEAGSGVYEPLGLPIHRFSAFVSPEERRAARERASSIPAQEISSHIEEGLPVGEHASAGALRYFARADIAGQPHAEAILRRYLEAALLTASVTRNLLADQSFDVVCLNHALYVPQGIVAAVARARDRRVVAWNVAYRKRSFIFSHGETYHHSLMSEPTSAWEDMAWSPTHEREIMEYLTSRRRSGRDWIAFQHSRPQEDLTSIMGTLGVSLAKPVIGMLTNVAWDAQLHYPANAFPDMLTWVRETIRYFANRSDLQLVIRVHPAELTGGIRSRQPVVEEVRRAFPELPPNIVIIPPESRISTYAVMEACDAVIVYGTKTGVELTSLGIPVIVAGEAWIRNKGVTVDAASADDYFRILDRLPFRKRMSEDLIARARKYAYHFFFRRMIPVAQVAPTGLKDPQFRVEVAELADLLPGRSLGLDVICDGICKGTPFEYPAEQRGGVEDG
jgi:hypothetical protein